MTRPAHSHQPGPILPPVMAPQQLGNLDSITDSERNALRPIGSTAREIALRTGGLLADLAALPGVLIFQAVQPADADIPRVPHVMSAGRRVVLVESVAWPPGAYDTTDDGRIHCDGVYIGQSVRPLLTALLYWRKTLPQDHGVCAVVVVHPVSDGLLSLPTTRMRAITWTSADNAVHVILHQFFAGRRAASPKVLRTLAAASGGPCRDTAIANRASSAVPDAWAL